MHGPQCGGPCSGPYVFVAAAAVPTKSALSAVAAGHACRPVRPHVHGTRFKFGASESCGPPGCSVHSQSSAALMRLSLVRLMLSLFPCYYNDVHFAKQSKEDLTYCTPEVFKLLHSEQGLLQSRSLMYESCPVSLPSTQHDELAGQLLTGWLSR